MSSFEKTYFVGVCNKVEANYLQITSLPKEMSTLAGFTMGRNPTKTTITTLVGISKQS